MPYQDMKWLKQLGAVATNEVNAAMGIICATPAGSSGTIPGVLFKLENT